MKDANPRTPPALLTVAPVRSPHADRKIFRDRKFTDEPAIPRFFLGRKASVFELFQNPLRRFRENFGDCL
jgi:hypothetical protein